MVGSQWDVANERDERLKQKLMQIQLNLSTKAAFGTEENGRSREVTVMVGWGVIWFSFGGCQWRYFSLELLLYEPTPKHHSLPILWADAID